MYVCSLNLSGRWTDYINESFNAWGLQNELWIFMRNNTTLEYSSLVKQQAFEYRSWKCVYDLIIEYLNNLNIILILSV